MSLWKIAWRSIQQRGLASALTALSMALGVLLVVAVLSIHGVVSQSFKNNSSLGYNLIVGAKGGKLQLTLNTVYYLSQPVENIPYEYYLEFTDGGERERALEHSIRAHVHDAQWDSIVAASMLGADGLAGLGDRELDGVLVYTADHGNADIMYTEFDGVRSPKTSHTLSPVPFAIFDPNYDGEYHIAAPPMPGLANVAATLCNLLGFEPPDDYLPSLIEF